MMQAVQRSIRPWQATSVAKEDAVADNFAAAPSRKQLSTGSKRTYQDMDAVSTTAYYSLTDHLPATALFLRMFNVSITVL